MPPHIQPLSLRETSVERVAQLAFHSFVAIEAKYERCEWSTSLQKEVGDLQAFFLSNIQHLWDDVCQVIYGMYILQESTERRKMLKFVYCCRHRLKDLRILTTLMIHDQMRKLKLSYDIWFFKEKVCLSEIQMGKLKSIVILDIKDIKLTNKMMEIIGWTCKDLQEIHMTLCSKNATLDSLNNLLNCRELQKMDIAFAGWNKEQYEPYLINFLTKLPKLKSCYRISDILPKLMSETSIKELSGTHIANVDELKNIFRMCPHVQHLFLTITTKILAEREKVLTFLAECSLQLCSLVIYQFTFGKSMGHLLERKGGNLTKLVLEECYGLDMTFDDIYAIGTNCPKLEHLKISEFMYMSDEYNEDPSYRSPVLYSETLIATNPAMFRNLQCLRLSPRKGWDIRFLLQILFHANRLQLLSVENLYFHGSSDLLAEILNVNSFTELERLSFSMPGNTVVKSEISQYSIERLLVSCPKLIHLTLDLPLKRDVFLYMEELWTKVRKENRNLELFFEDPPESPIDLLDFVDSDLSSDFEDSDE